jgi:ribosome-associated heat shock protein Hsp15
MRVDKFLWCIRAFKTRSLASAQCREGKVSVNGKEVKPSQELRGEETIRVRKGAVYFEWEVLGLPKNRITPETEKQKLEEIRAAQRDLLRPTGRPTKRDRRDWEKWFS